MIEDLTENSMKLKGVVKMTKFYQCPHCQTIQENQKVHNDEALAICKSCDKYYRQWAVNEVKA